MTTIGLLAFFAQLMASVAPPVEDEEAELEDIWIDVGGEGG